MFQEDTYSWKFLFYCPMLHVTTGQTFPARAILVFYFSAVDDWPGTIKNQLKQALRGQSDSFLRKKPTVLYQHYPTIKIIL